MSVRGVVGAIAAAIVFGLASAAADANPSGPPASLSASPSRVRVAAGGRATLQVTNSGRRTFVVDAAPAGYALDLRGRPHIVRAPVSWVAVRPARFRLAPGASLPVTVTAPVSLRAAPGDHAALILLATRPADVGHVAVALRVGVVVDVRVPGAVVRKLEVRGVRVQRLPQSRKIEIVVANRGNVSELLRPRRLHLQLRRHGRLLAKLRVQGQELLPRSTGIVDARYRGSVRGEVTAVVELSGATGQRPLRRSFQVRL